MKKHLIFLLAATIFAACNSKNQLDQTETQTNSTSSGQSGVKDDVSSKNVVQIAESSKDHTTLTAAIKAADLVDALSNAGPFTVFAPTNAAFDKLPAGTLNNLLKNENKDKLADILQYHVAVGVYKEESFQDGQTIGEVNGSNITITKKDGKTLINGAVSIAATIQASNGIVYIIDGVLTPSTK